MRLTLNRPEKLNALTLKLLTELNEALWEADNDRDVHCVIVKGAGRAFSAGYDLRRRRHVPVRGFNATTTVPRRPHHRRRRLATRARAAAAHGAVRHAQAGHRPGARLLPGRRHRHRAPVRHGDRRRRRPIGFPPARDLGALPNNMWLYNVGPQWAKRLMMTGDTITGAEAQQIGLVMKAVPARTISKPRSTAWPTGWR